MYIAAGPGGICRGAGSSLRLRFIQLLIYVCMHDDNDGMPTYRRIFLFISYATYTYMGAGLGGICRGTGSSLRIRFIQLLIYVCMHDDNDGMPTYRRILLFISYAKYTYMSAGLGGICRGVASDLKVLCSY